MLSHGSVLCGAARELSGHAERVRKSGEFCCVEVGFLNYSKPTLDGAIAACAAVGAEDIIVVPYFLAPGHFALKIVREALAAHVKVAANIQFRIADPIGYDARIAGAILRLADSAKGGESWNASAQDALIACSENMKCPLYGHPGCKAADVAGKAG